MKKYRWGELPEPVREGIRERVGTIAECQEIEVGQSSNFAAILHRDGAPPLFVKGVEGVSPPMRWLRNEADLGELVSGIAPAVHFSADIGDWLVVGFEYARGRRAQLVPGATEHPLGRRGRRGDHRVRRVRRRALELQGRHYRRAGADRA